MSNPNVGYLFYKDYYQDIDLRQVEDTNTEADIKLADKTRQKKISDQNKNIFEGKNRQLLNTKINVELAQSLYRNPVAELQTIHLITTYPGLLLGTGYLHETGSEGEFKLGFFFDYTTGYPVIPGSSVKGTLRSVFPSFASVENDLLQANLKRADEVTKNKAKYIWYLLQGEDQQAEFTDDDYQLIHQLELAVFEGWNLAKNKSESKENQVLPLAKRVIFFDGLLDAEKNIRKHLLAEDAITPHGKNPLKNPIPLKMLKVAPGIAWTFRFRLQAIQWSNGTHISKEQLNDLFTRILLDQGIGAKTNVGYGQFIEPPKPIVFKKDQEVEGIVVDKKPGENRREILFEVEGNPGYVIATVSEKLYNACDEGQKYLLKVSSVNSDDQSIKYVKVVKAIIDEKRKNHRRF